MENDVEPMTEPMTARELADRAANEYLEGVDWNLRHGPLTSIIERAILAARAAERARLAQSGDVEGLAQWLKLTWAQCRDETGGWETLARHVQAKLAATAEAARIEGRREGIEATYATVKNLEGDAQDSRDADRRAGNFESAQFYTDRVLALASAMVAIAALRPDELEKKT